MDTQTLINVGFAVCGSMAGFILKGIWDSLKELQRADKELVKKVQNIEVLIAGDYVKKEEFDRVVSRVFERIDAMADRLAGKIDGIAAVLSHKVDKSDWDGFDRRT